MSTVIISLILIGSIMLLVLSLIYIHKKNIKKKRQKLLSRFSEFGILHSLSFSSQEVLRNKIIGLDGIHRKFVFVNEKEEATVVSLDEVKNCKVIKNFETYNMGDSKNSDIERHLTSIQLLFEFKNNNNPVSVIFYDNMIHPIYEVETMEAKAKDWEILLTKMLVSSEKIRA